MASKLRPDTSSLLGSRPVSLAILPSTAARCSAAAHGTHQYRLHTRLTWHLPQVTLMPMPSIQSGR